MPLESFRHLPVRLSADVPDLAELRRRGLVAKRRLYGPLCYYQLAARGCAELDVSVHYSRPMGSVALYHSLMLLAYAEYQDEKHEIVNSTTTWKDQRRMILIPGPYTPISGIVRNLRSYIRNIVEADGEHLELCRARKLGFIVFLTNQTKTKALDRFLTEEATLRLIAPIRCEYVRVPTSWGLVSRFDRKTP